MHMQLLQADHFGPPAYLHHELQHGCSPAGATQAVDVERQQPDGPARGAHFCGAPGRELRS